MIHKLSQLKYLFFTAVVIFFLGFIGSVSAQSQEDVTVCEFDPTVQKGIQVQLNYNCGNIEWLPKAYQMYRRIDKTKFTCPANADEVESSYIVKVKPNGDSIDDRGEGPVEDYLLFYSTMSMSERESITWFENAINDSTAGLTLMNRKLPRPYYVDDNLLGMLDETTRPKLEGYKGYIVCPVYEVQTITENGKEVGKFNTSNIVAFKKADLVPPTFQQTENLSVQIIYMIWGLTFIYGMLRLTYLGFQFIYGGTSPERLGELRSNFILWFVGLVVIVLAIPFINYLYSLAGISTTSCYKLEKDGELVYDLSIPGFTFFFNDVCTSEITSG